MNGFPTGQILCLTYTTKNNKKYYITKNKDGSKYTSWEQTEGKPQKIRTSSSPITLEKDFK